MGKSQGEKTAGISQNWSLFEEHRILDGLEMEWGIKGKAGFAAQSTGNEKRECTYTLPSVWSACYTGRHANIPVPVSNFR